MGTERWSSRPSFLVRIVMIIVLVSGTTALVVDLRDRTMGARSPWTAYNALSVLALAVVFALVAGMYAPRPPTVEQRARQLDERGRRIRKKIRWILMRDWDPLGVSEISETQDEYEAYVEGVHRVLASGGSEREIVEHLARIQLEAMGHPDLDHVHLASIARKLLALDPE